MLIEMKKNFTKPMVNYLYEDVNEKLHSLMTEDCETNELCETFFQRFFAGDRKPYWQRKK